LAGFDGLAFTSDDDFSTWPGLLAASRSVQSNPKCGYGKQHGEESHRKHQYNALVGDPDIGPMFKVHFAPPTSQALAR
jgi:hypothetical protein